MSHFSVLVATKNAEDLDAALQPFHEFECTGRNDQYVIDVDITEEARKEYESRTEERYKDADGTLHDPYDEKFYRDLTEEEKEKVGTTFGSGWAKGISYTSREWGDGLGYRAKTSQMPDGWEKVFVPIKDVETFAQHVEGYHGKKPVPHGSPLDLESAHKFGYALLDENGDVVKVIDRTNPNKQWDWWVIGGRYQGRLLDRDGQSVDACRKSDLDIDGMRRRAQDQRQSSWGECCSRATAAGIFLTGEELDQRRREFYLKKQAEVEAWLVSRPDRKPHYQEFMGDMLQYEKVFDDFLYPIATDRDVPVQEWIDSAPALSSFAVLKGGEWFERGSMGWWGVVHDEKDESTWEAEFSKMLADLPDDTWITIVDCHI